MSYVEHSHGGGGGGGGGGGVRGNEGMASDGKTECGEKPIVATTERWQLPLAIPFRCIRFVQSRYWRASQATRASLSYGYQRTQSHSLHKPRAKYPFMSTSKYIHTRTSKNKYAQTDTSKKARTCKHTNRPEHADAKQAHRPPPPAPTYIQR